MIKNYFSYFSTKLYVVGTQKNPHNEHSKQMFKMIDNKIFTIICSKIKFTGKGMKDGTNDQERFL